MRPAELKLKFLFVIYNNLFAFQINIYIINSYRNSWEEAHNYKKLENHSIYEKIIDKS